jgi:transcriptional regulator with GAF, ATPase, and Fis domain
MDDQHNLIDMNALFNHWMNQMDTSEQYKELTDEERQRLQQNSKDFLARLLHSTPKLATINTEAVTPLLEFLRAIRTIHAQQGLSIRDTTLLALSLKSSITEYLQATEIDTPIFNELNHLLDMFSVLSFELYSHEQESLIGKQAQHINYLQSPEGHAFGTLIGRSKAMKTVYQAIGLVLENDITVLLQGESGTGKDVIANAIHHHSSRKRKPFVTVNCGAIPNNLIESELFGHEQGAFTGADKQRIGKFEQADHGTIFLDEISELSLAHQTTLLRVIQNQEIQRVGGNTTLPINVRIIAASNKSLETLVKKETFRLDLFYRINVFPIHIPNLSKRENDVIELAHHFIDKYSHIFNLKKPRITASAEHYLLTRNWPGNIRELENMIQRAMIIANGNDITEPILSFQPGQTLQTPLLPKPTPTTAHDPFIPLSLDDHEANIIQKTCRYFNGNIKKAAETLGVSRTTLYSKLKKYNIHVD